MRMTRRERLTYWRIQGVSVAVGSLVGLAAGYICPVLVAPVAFVASGTATRLQIRHEKRK